MASNVVANQLSAQLLKAAQVVEEQIDSEIKNLERLDEDDLEVIRRKRVDQIKKGQQQKQDWVNQGHGEYSELPDERSFFDACKKHKRLVVHFYRESTFRCKIVDKHLTIIAQKHLETKFVKIDVEKAPFLVTRLKVQVLPSIAVIKECEAVDWIRGFDELGGIDEFTTDALQWRLSWNEGINYSGGKPRSLGVDKPGERSSAVKAVFGPARNNKTIRDTPGDSEDDDW